MNRPGRSDFESLSPDQVISSVEAGSGLSLLPVANPLPSYINRVYELKSDEGERFVAKFYRPGRWSLEALREEHDFMEDCGDMDIPLALPEFLLNDDTIGTTEEGIHFALFPYKSGRLWEFREDEDQWYRLGRLLGRMHAAGSRERADHRPRIHPDGTFMKDCTELLENNWITPGRQNEFEKTVRDLGDLIRPLFRDTDELRIHGDFHSGNILDRLNEGLMIIDFDDMAMGPAVQDFWLLLPGHASDCRREFFMILDGYQEFRPLSMSSMSLIEPLRAMRMVYFLAWCGRQRDDFSFRNQFPGWGSDSFWENEIRDLRNQYHEIQDFMEKV